MNIAIYAVTFLAVVLGVGVSIWSFFDTRRRYYEEFLNRKRHG